LALLIALVAALVLAVLVVLAVFAWVLLAPLVRMGRAGKEPAEVEVEATVLFGRPRAGGRTRAQMAPASVLPPPPPSAPAAPPQPAVAAPPSPDVLVVTADTSLSDCQLAILAASGCVSRCATNASDAVSQLRLRRPDLLWVDAAGAGACEAVPLVTAVRAWAATESLPVVLFMPNPDADVSRSAIELHVTDVVVDAQSVPRLVERALPYWLAGVGVFSSTAG
jgi:CheY-like chemotaxis protein